MRFITVVTMLVLFCFTNVIHSQTHILKPNGDLITKKQLQKISKNRYSTRITSEEKTDDIVSTPDTLSYSRDYNFNTDFGFFGQDVMMQFFVAPADMTIKGIGFSCSDDSGAVNGADISVRLIKLNWDYEKFDSIQNEINFGYYQSEDSTLGGNHFGELNSGNWVDLSSGQYPLPPWTNNIDPSQNTFQYDIWSDSGKGVSIIPVKQESAGNYQWIDTYILGFEPVVQTGEVFAVVIKHTGQNLGEDRIGFWASNEPGVLGWKFYASDRFAPNSGLGWWVRQYTWDFAVAVEFTDRPRIVIRNITQLTTTLSTEPRRVEATIITDNPSGGQSGIASAELLYSINSGVSFDTVKMEYEGDFIWSGEIPGQTPGTEIIYKIRATDIGGYFYESNQNTYRIFESLTNELLIIFNGGTEGRAQQLTPYYLQDIGLNYDLWASYGPVEKELIKQYIAVLEIQSENGPEFDNRDALREFVDEGNGVLKFGVIGQEALGYLIGYRDSVFTVGDYEYDILGVQRSYNDVNYDTSNGIGNNSPSLVNATENTDLGDPLFTWISENYVDSLFFDPPEILGSENWMDQFDPRGDISSEVFMTGYSFNGIEKPIGHNYTHQSGTEVCFMSFDPLALTTDSMWVGYSHQNPLYQFLSRIVIPSVEKLDYEIPNSFSLSQNYPNPFNPNTTITYSIPITSVISNPQQGERSLGSNKNEISPFGRNDNINVTLKVYDILGREVATLVNQTQKPGNYKVEFDASKFTSGVYFYRLNAGEFIESKKMILIK